MEGRMLNNTNRDRKTNVWIRERTKVIKINSNVRKMKRPRQGTSTASKTPDSMTLGNRQHY